MLVADMSAAAAMLVAVMQAAEGMLVVEMSVQRQHEQMNKIWNLTLSYTGSGTYIVEQGGANLPRMTFGFKNYQNCPQM